MNKWITILMIACCSCENWSSQTSAEELPIEKHEKEAMFTPPAFYEPPTDLKLQTTGDQILLEAREYLEVPYEWDGRSKTKIDCLGLTSLAISSVTSTSWKKFPVNPSDFPADKKYGTPVSGLDPILVSELETKLSDLQVGDFIAFLLEDYHHRLNNRLLFVTTDVDEDGVQHEYGGWHTAIYAGNGNVIHAKPGDKVKEEGLKRISFDALYVKRIVNTP